MKQLKVGIINSSMFFWEVFDKPAIFQKTDLDFLNSHFPQKVRIVRKFAKQLPVSISNKGVAKASNLEEKNCSIRLQTCFCIDFIWTTIWKIDSNAENSETRYLSRS